MKHHALGLDFGTSSCRALIVDVRDGAEVGVGVADYAQGDGGVLLDPQQPDLARQVPDDWRVAGTSAVRRALAAAAEAGVAPTDLVGVGVDATGSTPLPVDAALQPLADDPRFAGRPEAQAWLWKDHTAQGEALALSAALRRGSPQALERCGGAYSSEWFWAKALRCARRAPEVFAAAATWVEASDWLPAWLVGIREVAALPRNACAAGHKSLFLQGGGGYPAAELLAALDPGLAALRTSLGREVVAIDRSLGGVSAAVAHASGLPVGLPVAAGALDAHLGAVGAGVREGDLVKVLGTSACDMTVVAARMAPAARGLSGVARDTIVPGMWGVEAGQAAFGDAFAWCAREIGRCEHAELERAAAGSRPGASGLLALEWLNGNRSVLADPALSGAIVGLGLHTRPDEIWRAMVEGAAFGARMIVERMIDNGVPVARLIVCGGIAQKSEFVVQTLADVLARPVLVASSEQTCALGAAIAGAVAAGRHPDVATAQAAMCRAPSRSFTPCPTAVSTYERLFQLYRAMHDAFGGVGGPGAAGGLGAVMKELIAMRDAARGVES